MEFNGNAMLATIPSHYDAPPRTRNTRPIICESRIGNMTIRVRSGTVSHICRKHEQDFEFAINGATDEATKEWRVATYLMDIISNSSHLYLTDVGSNRADTILLYFRRPLDKLHHCIVIVEDEDGCYRINTAYKKKMEDTDFTGKWMCYETKEEVWYQPGMQGIYTWAAGNGNPHLAVIQGLVYQPQHIFVPVFQPVFLVPVPIQYVPYPVPIYVQ